MIIEIASFLVIGWTVFFFVLRFKEIFSKWRFKKKYNPDDDLSKRGEERREFGKRESGIENAKPISSGPNELEGGRVLPSATPTSSGETDSSPRKYSSRLDLFKNLQK